MKQYTFNLRVSYERFLPIYQGDIDKIIVKDLTGLTIELAAKHLKPYLTPDGVNGQFKLLVDSRGKFQSLIRIF